MQLFPGTIQTLNLKQHTVFFPCQILIPQSHSSQGCAVYQRHSRGAVQRSKRSAAMAQQIPAEQAQG